MKRIILITVWFCLRSLPAFSQELPEEGSVVDTLILKGDIFNGEEPLIITLKFNIREYQRNKRKGEYMPAELVYHLNDSADIVKSIRLKARGNFRKDFCSMPPFWLNIRKSDVKNEALQNVTRMKVVTHCKAGKTSDTYILKEYLAYHIYNLLSPYSFRTRLVRMKYIDTGRKDRESEHWAILIEAEKMMADRLGAFSVKNDRQSMNYMLPEHLDRVAIFQYMIGNADYSVNGRHNLKIIGMNEMHQKGFIPVPYDFDYSGIVNAYYAIPGDNLGIESVTERYYLGACRDADSLRSTLDLFKQHREEILELMNSFPYLDDTNRNQVISYIEEFFNLADSGDFLIKEFNRTCR